MKKTLSNYINYGVSSNIATSLSEKGLPLSTFKSTSKKNLIEKYGIEEKIVDFVKDCITRKPIDNSVLENLLENSNYTCNVCKGVKGSDFIVHHIIEYSKSQDNSYNNLIVLCPVCHDAAHTTGGLTNSISKEELYNLKYKWEKTVKENNVISASKIDNIQEVEYINIPRITELILQLRNRIPETQYTQMLLDLQFINSDYSIKKNLFDCKNKSYPFDFGYSYIIKYHYYELFKSVMPRINIFDLDSILNKTSLLQQNYIGSFCFYVGGVFGNSPKLPINDSTPVCHLFFKRKIFYVEWIIDPKYVVSTTAIDRLSRHTKYTIYGMIRDITTKHCDNKEYIYILIIPYVIGAPKIEKNRIPDIKYIKEAEEWEELMLENKEYDDF